jgi:hypothetical protein
MTELLPDGAWLIAGLDIAASPAQKIREREATQDSKWVHTSDGGCQLPATHAAVAIYRRDDVAIATRGAFQREAMLDCLAEVGVNDGAKVWRSTIDAHDVLLVQKDKSRAPFVYTTDDHILMAAEEALMSRMLADELRPATDDPHLASLIARARAGGELWSLRSCRGMHRPSTTSYRCCR